MWTPDTISTRAHFFLFEIKSNNKLYLEFVDYGVYKVETKTKSTTGVDLTANCSSNHDTKKFVGSLETKYKWSDYGT